MITDTAIVPEEVVKTVWTPVTVRHALEEVLTEIQELGGNSIPEYADDLKIAVDVDRFDSLVAVDALALLTERFGEYMPDDLLYDPGTQQPLRLDQIVIRICEILGVIGVSGTVTKDEQDD